MKTIQGFYTIVAIASVPSLAFGTVVSPTQAPMQGVVATESTIGSHDDRYYNDSSSPFGLHVTSGIGTSGTSQPNYSPKGYYGPTSSAVSGYDSELSANNTNGTTASGRAATDLNSGQIHLNGQATLLGSGNDTSVASIYAEAQLSDIITITGSITAPVTVRFRMVVDGSFTGVNDSRNDIAYFQLHAGTPYAQVSLNGLINSTIQEQDTSSNGGKIIKDAGNASSLHLILYDDVIVTDTSRSVPFTAGGTINLIAPDSPGTVTANFGNTARLEISLPTGLGFTSQSGVLLTTPQDSIGTNVPEPASLLIFGSSLLATSIHQRHRHLVKRS